MPTSHVHDFLNAASLVCEKIDADSIGKIALSLSKMNGRLFVLGVGGSSANASHAVNDFRKLCAIEAYAPTDNIAEFTARTNDDGWNTTFREWLKVSKITKKDAILVLSVGGGTDDSSQNIVSAVKYANLKRIKVYGIVGSNDGYTAKHADIVIVIPCVEKKWITPLSEAFHMVVLHCLVSHPLLQKKDTRW